MQGFLKQPWSSITQQPSDSINPGLQTHTLSLQVFLLASVQSKFDWHSETREDKFLAAALAACSSSQYHVLVRLIFYKQYWGHQNWLLL